MRPVLAALLLTAAIAAHAQTASTSTLPSDTTSPGKTWQVVAPESVNFSSARLAALMAFLKAEPTTAMAVAVHGKLIFQYGDLSYVSSIASVRKSVLDMLYGVPAYKTWDNLNKPVKDLGLDGTLPLLPIEERAVLEQLLACRSGIFIIPDKPDPSSADSYQPRRGSSLPGTHFTYNEWDFNAAGVAFEKLTGRKIDDALASDLAAPLDMQDFHRDLQVEAPWTQSTNPPGYPMVLSTRDMARLGQLMLRQGNWNGKQIISSDWVRYSTVLWTPFSDMNPDGMREYTRPDRWGFGLMWFVWDEPAYLNHNWSGPLQGAFTAMGSGGQYITVLPELDMVIAHKVDLSPGHPSITPIQWDAILAMVIAAQCEDKCPANP